MIKNFMSQITLVAVFFQRATQLSAVKPESRQNCKVCQEILSLLNFFLKSFFYKEVGDRIAIRSK